jgi:hypothetical protein
MSNKNEVFEYLIDQLRQQLPVADVMGEIKRWSIDRSIAGRGNYTDEENAVIDAYIGLEHNQYKQQCEDLAHEVQSLKNQLRDASAQIKELREDNIKKSEHISHLTGQSSAYRGDALRFQAQVDDLVKRLATGDVEAYKLIRKGALGTEKSGCRKEDTQECDHNWLIAPGLFIAEGHKGNVPGSLFCCECGAREWDDPEYEPKAYTQKCKHEWEYYYPNGRRCTKCGVINL